MSRYRKVDPRIWNDAKFRSLSDDGKLVFFMLLTHPNMTALGAMRATVAGLAEEMAWEIERFREAFREALSKGMAEHDQGACLVMLPKFMKYNPPESPNVVKAWAASLDLLPECALKTRVVAESVAYLKGKSKAFTEALPEAFTEALPKAMPNQEQEQECVAIIDYAQLIAEKGENEVNRIGLISRGMKMIAQDLDMPVLLLSQLSRKCEERPDKRPMLSDLRGSGDIEQDASEVLFLYDDSVYHPNTTAAGYTELIIAKNRHGKRGIVLPLLKQLDRARFVTPDRCSLPENWRGLPPERTATARREAL